MFSHLFENKKNGSFLSAYNSESVIKKLPCVNKSLDYSSYSNEWRILSNKESEINPSSEKEQLTEAKQLTEAQQSRIAKEKGRLRESLRPTVKPKLPLWKRILNIILGCCACSSSDDVEVYGF